MLVLTPNRAAFVARYHLEMEALIRRFPIQEQNRKHYEARVFGARLARLTKAIRTKGGHTEAPKDAVVLVLDDDAVDAVSKDIGRPCSLVFVPSEDLKFGATIVETSRLEFLS